MTKSHIFDSSCAYAAKWCSNGRRGLLKVSSKCTPKHLKPIIKMHSSARYTHGERENRWFHRRRKSNENLNDKIACFSFPRVRIRLKWSPAPSKKIAQNGSENSKILFKNRIGSTARPSGRVGRRSYARFKTEIALDNIPTLLGRVWKAYAFKFMVLCLVAHDMRAHRSWEPSASFCSLKKRCARGFPEPQNFTLLLSMVEWGIAMVRIVTAIVELLP